MTSVERSLEGVAASRAGVATSRRLGRWRIVAVLAVLATVFGLLAACSAKAEAAEVRLEPAASSGPDPFTESVQVREVADFPTDIQEVVAPVIEEISSEASSEGSEPGSALAVEGTTPGLYGGSNQEGVCAPDELVAFLEANPDKAAAWASVFGIEPDGIGAYVDGLTPVLLLADTLVTNHGFRDGEANPIPAVLEAGTAVLVDDGGVPRVKCNCGNPLAPPEGEVADADEPLFSGEAWEEFDAEVVVEVEPGAPTEVLTVVELETGDPIEIPVGKSEQAEALDGEVVGDYEISADTVGTVRVHRAGDDYTVSVVDPFRVADAACDIPTGAVVARYAGEVPELRGRWYRFSPDTCVQGTAGGGSLRVNGDGTLTVSALGSEFVLVKVANAEVVEDPVVEGDYAGTFGEAEATVTVHRAGEDQTVELTSSLAFEESQCEVPAGTVLARYSGSAPVLGGRSFRFSPDTCVQGTGGGGDLLLNTDGSLTVDLNGRVYRLDRTGDVDEVSAPQVEGEYESVFGGVEGTLTVHRASDDYTVEVTSPVRFEESRCEVPAGSVVAEYSGEAPGLGGRWYRFSPDTCVQGAAGGGNLLLNTDGTLTVDLSGRVYLLHRTGDTEAVASPAAEGDYRGTIGEEVAAITVHRAEDDYTVSPTGPLSFEESQCTVSPGTVLAEYRGQLPVLSGQWYRFSPDTCAGGARGGGNLLVNTDGTLTVDLNGRVYALHPA